jgi:hypothetical protein
MLVLPLTLVGCFESSGGYRAISWRPFRPPPTSPRATARPCRSAELVPSLFISPQGSGAGGSVTGILILKKERGSPCSLLGRPSLRFSGRAAEHMHWRFRAHRLGAEGPSLVRADLLKSLHRGEAGWIQFFWENWCPSGIHTWRPPPLVVHFPRHRGTLHVRSIDSRVPSCSERGRPADLSWTRFVPRDLEPTFSSRLPLQATMIIDGRPAMESDKDPSLHVEPGERLRYIVALRNFSTRPFRFDACPTYTEQADFGYDPTRTIKRSYVLNCKPAATLPPGKAVLFEMLLTVPRNATRGRHSVSWTLAPETYLPPFDAGVFVVDD